MLLSCLLHVVVMLFHFFCYFHVTFMSFACGVHVVVMFFHFTFISSCLFDCVFMFFMPFLISVSCRFHFVFMSFHVSSCYFQFIFLSCSYHVHVIFTWFTVMLSFSCHFHSGQVKQGNNTVEFKGSIIKAGFLYAFSHWATLVSF